MGFYIQQSEEGREQITRETETESYDSQHQYKVQKGLLEDTVGVLQELLLRLTASKDKDVGWKIPSYDVYKMDNFWRRS